MKDRCEQCRFWQPLVPAEIDGAGFEGDRNYIVDDHGDGICRRLPPIGQRSDGPVLSEGREPANASDAALWAQWPVTIGDLDWCGEFQPAYPPAPKEGDRVVSFRPREAA